MILLRILSKLKQVLYLQKRFDECGLSKDSVYARILHRIGALQHSLRNLNEAINYTTQSVAINSTTRKGSSPEYAIRSYCNLGFYYKELNQYRIALASFDKCTIEGNKYQNFEFLPDIVDARITKGNIYNQTGDYQKAIEETTLGLKADSLLKDAASLVSLFNERAQAYAKMKLFNLALADVDKARLLIERNDYNALANNYKIRAMISEAHNDYSQALAYYRKAVTIRLKTHDTATLAMDYLDAGNSLRAKEIAGLGTKFSAAENYYTLSLQLAQKSEQNITAGKALNNLAAISFRAQKYANALTEYHNSLLHTIPSFKNNDPMYNPTYRQCNVVSNKNFLTLVLANKAECLLHLFKQTNNKEYLSAALKTALLTDSFITDMRHEQTGEQSKLYWRNETREFFTNAIEAAYLAKDAKKAFSLWKKAEQFY
ncbi:MAG: tetratricopeptide repeat protein [Segetibacter sp.]